MKYFTIILPVYNDWDCLQILLGQIEDTLKGTEANFELLLINDGSNNFSNLNFNKKKFFNKIRIINLRKNVGSQKAIATALKYISNNNEKFKRDFIIMDSDGEDRPEEISEFINQVKDAKDKNIVGKYYLKHPDEKVIEYIIKVFNIEKPV